MKDGYIRIAAVTPDLKVADVTYNISKICENIRTCAAAGAKVIVFPELCMTGYSCGDLFLQELLIERAMSGLSEIAAYTKETDAIVFVGLPVSYKGKLYNTAAAVCGGEILGIVPKTHLPNYNEFYELRHFAKGMETCVSVTIGGKPVPMGRNLLFSCSAVPGLVIAAEICEDLWAPNPPSIAHALSGAVLIVNLSASDEATGKEVYRRDLVCGQSARLLCGYVYAGAGIGESTQDVVYSGHNLIAENGVLLAESERFENEVTVTEIDLNKLLEERRRNTVFAPWDPKESYREVVFSLHPEELTLTRRIDPSPFVPGRKEEREQRCDEILTIQAMPGFGTTDRTYANAVRMVKCLGASFLEIPIQASVCVHFKDIGQDESIHDVTYENAQARERTQILMDLANKEGGMVIGTGDMSELALGWATYNGDHMSMYGVNASVPKTLVRHLVRYYADTCGDAVLCDVLTDVLDTPVSPELLPPEDGKISQKTEDLVGPYELHDFFLYYMLRFGYPPKKIYRLAKQAFLDKYGEDVIIKWLENFYRRFFSQQFKRSCLPDGPKVGTVAMSPRGDLRMPSDASAAIWLDEIDKLAKSIRK